MFQNRLFRGVSQAFWLTVFLSMGSANVAAQAPNAPPIPDPFEFLNRFTEANDLDDAEELSKVTVSRKEETQAGEQALRALLEPLERQKVEVRESGKDVEYLRRLVAQIRPLMKNAKRYRRIRILLVETDHTDARSFPGGTIVISRGMMDFCETEAALVGVLGHELSHIDRGHQLRFLKRWKLTQQSLANPSPQSLMSMGMKMGRMFSQPFRPEEETEADADATKWLFALGYEPIELARVFQRLQTRDANQPDFRPAFLRSHPFHIDRFNAIQEQVKALHQAHPEKSATYIGRENLRRRIPRTQRAFRE